MGQILIRRRIKNMDFESDPRFESIESLMELLRCERQYREAESARKQTRKSYQWVQIDKEMPEVLQSLIQDFARPVCRHDWRSCKSEEALAIHLLKRDKLHVVADFIGGPEFWDIVIGQTFYELLKNYPAGPSDEGQTTLQLRRVWV